MIAAFEQDMPLNLIFGLGLRPLHFAPLMGNGIFTQDGAQWHHSRQLLRPQLMSNRFNNLERIKSAVTGFDSCIPENEPVDLQPFSSDLHVISHSSCCSGNIYHH